MSDRIHQASPIEGLRERRAEYVDAVFRVMDGGRYILGPEVLAFEEEFADFVGIGETAVGVANGTDALEVALRAVGVRPGDGVVTVSHTAGATVAAIVRARAVPVLVDVDEVTMTMAPEALEEALGTPRGLQIRAVVPVHLYGALADMPRIVDIAARHNVTVVEDCAQAHGASLDGKSAGRWGDAAAFSFYPTKNLGALGDAGAVVTSRHEVAEAARSLREYGWRRRQFAEGEGFNSRLDEIQAAILRVGLRHLAEDNERRRSVATRYDEGLGPSRLRLPTAVADGRHVYHQYVVRSARRDDLWKWCHTRGVDTAVHYAAPVHAQPGLVGQCVLAGGMGNTERVASEVLSLPMYPQLEPHDVQRVIDVVNAWPG